MNTNVNTFIHFKYILNAVDLEEYIQIFKVASYWAENCCYANQTLKANRITSSVNKCYQCLIPKMYCSTCHWHWHTTVCMHLYAVKFIMSQLSADMEELVIICTIPCHQNRALNSIDLFKCKEINCKEVYVSLASLT